MQTQKDLVEASPDHAIMNIDILSFGRLAYRVMEETGGNQKIVLDDEGKNLILRKIAGDYEDELTILRGNLKRQGYISEVKSVISEFAQYDIREEQIDAMMEQAGVGTSLYYKLSDLKKVYQGFYAYLEENYITREEILDLLCERVPKSAILKDSVLALDGFTGVYSGAEPSSGRAAASVPGREGDGDDSWIGRSVPLPGSVRTVRPE